MGLMAQDSDTLKYFTQGDITTKVVEVETIEIRPECRCTGACGCEATDFEQERTRFASTDEVLETNGRVSLIRRGNFAFEPVLNGMAANRTSLTIDGMKIFAACTDKMDPVTAYVETNNLKSFAVHSGATGGEFGSTIAGSIDMVTQGAKLRPQTPISGEVGAGYHSASRGLSGLFSLNHSGDKYAVAANGVFRKSENYRAGGGQTVPYSQFEKWNGSLSGVYLLSERDVLRADIIVDDAYDIGYPALPMDVAFAKARIYGLTHRRSFSGKVKSIQTKVYANTVAHAMDDTQRPDVFMHMDMPGWTQTFGAFTKADIEWKKHRAVVKLDGYLTNARAEMTMYPTDDVPMLMLTWPDVEKRALALYVEDEWRMSDRDTWKLGVRLEAATNEVLDALGIQQATVFNQDLSKTDKRFMPTTQLTYQRRFGENVRTWITAGYTERAPTVSEQYAFYIFNAYDGYDYIGDVDLENEHSLQGDIGMDAGFGGFDLRSTAFYYRLYDYILGISRSDISPMTHGASGVRVYSNISGATMTGGSLQMSYEWKFGLRIESQTTYTRGSDSKGNPLPLIPPLKNRLGLQFEFDRSFAEVVVESASPQKRVDSDYGEQPSSGYSLIHVRGGTYFPWSNNRLTVHLGVENLLDRNYRDHLDWGGIPRPGINAYLNLAFAF